MLATSNASGRLIEDEVPNWTVCLDIAVSHDFLFVTLSDDGFADKVRLPSIEPFASYPCLQGARV